MENPLQIARQILLTPGWLDEQAIARTLDGMLRYRVDEAELYFQLSRHESWSLEDGIVKEGSYNIEQGVGVRAVSGEKTGFAYSDEIVLPALMRASDMARAIAKQGGASALQAWHTAAPQSLYAPLDPLPTLKDADKVKLLEQVDRKARRQDSRVKQVMVSLSGVHEVVLVAASDGTFAADVRPLVRFNVSVIAEKNGRREQGYAGCGGRTGYAYFQESGRVLALAREAVRQALVNLDAGPAPAGNMTVVLGPGWPGILLHEAIGHGLEGDFNRKGTSAFSGRIGEKVASELCTVVDDEGTPAHCTTLIENGILRGYMQDKLNARLMGVAPTGNGRRESFAHLPMPPMTNTYMQAGSHDPEEILRSVKEGLYAVNFGGGQVDITNGKFVFSASEAYLIEDGKVTAPLKNCTLIGNGPEVLTRVSMVGNDLKLDEGVGVCGKDGQSVPVGVGMPPTTITA